MNTAQRFDRIELIHHGRSASILRALDLVEESTVAIKQLSPEADALSQDRFAQEISVLRQFTGCDSVVCFLAEGHSCESAENSPYFVMEYIEGHSLQDFVKLNGGQPVEIVIPLAKQLVGALLRVHEQDILHRDLTPANVMLMKADSALGIPEIKLIDFGLARSLTRGHVSDPGIAGTPAYMSPESIESPQEVDFQSDIFSLGCLLYFLLSGRAPIAGANPIETCWRQVRDLPTPISQQIPTAIPKWLEQLIMACLAKAPEDRPASLVEIASSFDSAGI